MVENKSLYFEDRIMKYALLLIIAGLVAISCARKTADDATGKGKILPAKTQKKGSEKVEPAKKLNNSLAFRVVVKLGEKSSAITITKAQRDKLVKQPLSEKSFTTQSGFKYCWRKVLLSTEDSIENGVDAQKKILRTYRGRLYILLADSPGYCMRADNSWGVKSVKIVEDVVGETALSVTLDKAGGEKISIVTSKCKGKELAVVALKKVYSAPTVQTMIKSQLQITGRFTKEELESIKKAFETGKPKQK